MTPGGEKRLIVYNPYGGAAFKRSRLTAALKVLRALPGTNVLVKTEAADMAAPVRRALAEHPDTTLVVACGGDGTVGACAGALDGRDVPIAIIPTGTTNVLSCELGLPSHPVRAARILAGPTRTVAFRTWRANDKTMLLQLGVGFVEKGARLTIPGATNDTIAIAKLSYLEFPMLFKIEPARHGVRPFGLLGPSFGINVGAHVDASASGGPSSADVSSELRTADVGVAVGGGVTDGRWFAEIRWTQGVIDVGESRRVDDPVRTRTVAILAGIRF